VTFGNGEEKFSHELVDRHNQAHDEGETQRKNVDFRTEENCSASLPTQANNSPRNLRFVKRETQGNSDSSLNLREYIIGNLLSWDKKGTDL
jgi:hypothetical protein